MNTEPLDIRLPLSRLSSNPVYRDFTPPLSSQEYDDLKKSILKVGILLQPIIVEFIEAKNSYDIVDGYNRFNITSEAAFIDVPCRQIFTEDQRLEAILSNVNRRQLTQEQRADLIRRSRAMIVEAGKSLIAPLLPLYKNGELAKYIGHHNVHFLLNASRQTQEEFYAKIGLAFAQPTPSNAREAQLLTELKQLRANQAIADTHKQQLQTTLEAVTKEAEQLRAEVEQFDQRLDDTVSKRSDHEKHKLEKRLAGLSEQVTTLTTQKEDATKRSKVLEEQLKTAESEMSAARIAAKDAERRLQQTTHRLGNPQLITNSFDSLLKLAETIHSMIQSARPLHTEDIKQFQQHLTLARQRLDDLETALLPGPADVIPLHKHLKPKSPVAAPSARSSQSS